MFFRILTVLTVCAACLWAEDAPSLKLSAGQNGLWVQATSATMALRYGDAMEAAKKLRSENEGAGCVLENIVRISVYDDKGDTTALQKAGQLLEKCKTEGLWDALKSFSWVPFKSDNRELYLATLDSASKKSERFWPLFLTPLIWMHYDKEDFSTGLSLADRGLSRAPNHPVMLQIKADMLYRLKRYDEAARIYEKSAADYLKRTGESIRYWCSVLNLVRIYHDAGKKEKAAEWRAKLDSPKYRALKGWMPGSLMDDLEKRKLL